MMEAHAGQTDKQGQPYWTHPDRVAGYLGPDAPDFAKVAAYLHDVLEDTPFTPSRLIDRGVGTRSMEIMKLVSRVKGETYAQFIERIAASGDVWAIRVKLADLRDNLSRPLPPEMAGIHRRYTKAKATLLAALAAIPCPVCGDPVLYGGKP